MLGCKGLIKILPLSESSLKTPLWSCRTSAKERVLKFELLTPFVVVGGSVAYKIISTNSNNLSHQPLINKNVLRWAIKKKDCLVT